jgi:hypothetical protein
MLRLAPANAIIGSDRELFVNPDASLYSRIAMDHRPASGAAEGLSSAG